MITDAARESARLPHIFFFFFVIYKRWIMSPQSLDPPCVINDPTLQRKSEHPRNKLSKKKKKEIKKRRCYESQSRMRREKCDRCKCGRFCVDSESFSGVLVFFSPCWGRVLLTSISRSPVSGNRSLTHRSGAAHGRLRHTLLEHLAGRQGFKPTIRAKHHHHHQQQTQKSHTSGADILIINH